MDQDSLKRTELRGSRTVGPVPECEAKIAHTKFPSIFDVTAAVDRAARDSGCAPEKAPDPEQELLKELNGFKIGLDDWRSGAERHGIPREYEYAEEDVATETSRLPKRISWRCSCEDGVAVQVPRGSVIHATCDLCFARFKPDTLTQSMRSGRMTRKIVRK